MKRAFAYMPLLKELENSKGREVFGLRSLVFPSVSFQRRRICGKAASFTRDTFDDTSYKILARESQNRTFASLSRDRRPCFCVNHFCVICVICEYA